jgi:hypothetical protein
MRVLAVTKTMADISRLYKTCQELFTDYPLAVRADNSIEAGRSMVLMTHDAPAFFVLWLDYRKDRPVYSIGPWPAGDIAEISANSNTRVSATIVKALTHGVPIPRDGSLFGWTYRDVVTALVVVYADESEGQVPSWTVMPLAGTPEWQWPPFTDERLFGEWFWEHYWSGDVICLGDLVAGNPDTVFWVDTKATLGSDCCAVARDIKSSTGHTVRRGCYVYFQALRARESVPSLKALLTEAGKVDLALRYDSSVVGTVDGSGEAIPGSSYRVDVQ